MASKKKSAGRRAGRKKKDAPDPLRLAAPQFHGRLDGLRELQEIISPHVAALDIFEEGGVGKLIEKGGFSETGVEVMRGIFEPGAQSGEEAGGGESQGDSESVSPQEQAALALESVLSDEMDAFQGFVRKMVRGAVAPREELLNSSLLTLAVAALENLLALLVTEQLRRFPGALETEEKAFSLADLQGVGSIDDARTVLIERKVDSFMRKGIDDWSTWTAKTLGAGFQDLCIDLDSVKEMFQRRHLVVHAGGIVNRMYLERAPLPKNAEPELGSYLPTSGEYVLAALDEFEVLGDLLLFSAWNKWLDGTARDAGREEFESRILELMGSKRWRVVQRLCEQAESLDFPTSTQLVFKVNRWIAMTNLDRFDDSCREQVEEWDTSALAAVFVMAQAILLGDENRALRLLEVTVAAGELGKRDAETWPLFAALRPKRKFKKALAKGLEQANAAEVAADKAPTASPSKKTPKPSATSKTKRQKGSTQQPKEGAQTGRTKQKGRRKSVED